MSVTVESSTRAHVVTVLTPAYYDALTADVGVPSKCTCSLLGDRW